MMKMKMVMMMIAANLDIQHSISDLFSPSQNTRKVIYCCPYFTDGKIESWRETACSRSHSQ